MKEVVKNVVEQMAAVLNREQIEVMRQVLEKELECATERIESDNSRLLEDFIASKHYENCSEQTIQQYRRENTKFLEKIGKPVQDIKKKDIERYLSEYKEKNSVSNVTLNNMRRFISAFFNYLEYEDIILSNPVRKTKPIKETKKIKESFSDREIEEMRDTATNMRDKAIIEVLNTTGVRISELCSMNVTDIHNRHAVIKGKGDKERRVYFSDRALYYVMQYLAGRNDNNPALFVNFKKTGEVYGRVSKNSVEKMIRELGREINVRAYPHKFRRTVATKGINKGMPLQEVRVLLGHSKLDTTLIYCNVSESNIEMSHRRYIS